MRRIFLLGLILVGCGGDDDVGYGGGACESECIQRYCEDACVEARRCGPVVDDCIGTCQRSLGPQSHLRAAFFQLLSECQAGLSCSELVDPSAYDVCVRLIMDRLQPTAAASAACAALDTKLAECEGTITAGTCTEALLPFSDSAATRAESCARLSCEAVPSCWDRALDASG